MSVIPRAKDLGLQAREDSRDNLQLQVFTMLQGTKQEPLSGYYSPSKQNYFKRSMRNI